MIFWVDVTHHFTNTLLLGEDVVGEGLAVFGRIDGFKCGHFGACNALGDCSVDGFRAVTMFPERVSESWADSTLHVGTMAGHADLLVECFATFY